MALSRSGSNLLKPISPFFSCAPSILSHSISSSNDSITMESSIPFTAHNCEPPSRSVTTSVAELRSFFRDMALMCRMEIAANSLYKIKLIHGYCHLYDGQEAVTVEMEAAITGKDYIITAYHDHCTFLSRGGNLVEVFTELMGRRAGMFNGKGRSMHFYRKKGRFYGSHDIMSSGSARLRIGIRT